jgi:very-short-patch-repair endonuclease
MGKRWTKDDFIKRAREVHGDKYVYTDTIYTGTDNKMNIYCPTHMGFFTQRGREHLQGKHGCKQCQKENRTMTKDEFIVKSIDRHGDKYDYSLVRYERSTIPVRIICPEHGEYQQQPVSHIRGKKCQKCALSERGDALRSNTDDFINKARKLHGDKYDYSLVEYIKNSDAVKIICDIHGVFEQTAVSHVRKNGHGCRRCAKELCGVGYNEKELFRPWIRGLCFEVQFGYKFDGLPYFVDAYLPDHNLVIEYDEDHHEKQKDEDLDRQLLIEDYCGVRFYRIPDKDFLDKMDYHRDKIRRIIGI